jgi:hypothetical protein
MLQTMAWSFIASHVLVVMMSLLPVAVTKMSAWPRRRRGAPRDSLPSRLQGADGVDLGDPDVGAEAAQRLGRALADVAVAADHGDLAGDHHVGGALDGVDQGLAAAVEVVELGLGDRVVDVHGREQQLPFLCIS